MGRGDGRADGWAVVGSGCAVVGVAVGSPVAGTTSSGATTATATATTRSSPSASPLRRRHHHHDHAPPLPTETVTANITATTTTTTTTALLRLARDTSGSIMIPTRSKPKLCSQRFGARKPNLWRGKFGPPPTET